LVEVFSCFEDYGGVGFLQKEKADDGIERAHNGQNPENPPPSEILDCDAAEERA